LTISTDNNIIDSEGSKLFIETDLNAPNKRIVTVDAANPSPSNWVDFIPETENVLSPSTGAGFSLLII
jgi:prolyl oligopeptidase